MNTMTTKKRSWVQPFDTLHDGTNPQCREIDVRPRTRGGIRRQTLSFLEYNIFLSLISISLLHPFPSVLHYRWMCLYESSQNSVHFAASLRFLRALYMLIVTQT